MPDHPHIADELRGVDKLALDILAVPAERGPAAREVQVRAADARDDPSVWESEQAMYEERAKKNERKSLSTG